MPVSHQCQRRTARSRWPGQVRVTGVEITRLAAFTGLGEQDVIRQVLRSRHGCRGLALPERPCGGCVVLEGNDCFLQSVNPRPCRDFPNLWNFPGYEKSCRVISPWVIHAEFWRMTARAGERQATGVKPELHGNAH